MTPLAKLIFDALVFSEWAAGEGIVPVNGNKPYPEDFLTRYFEDEPEWTQDVDFETLAQRVAERIEYLEDRAWRYEEANK